MTNDIRPCEVCFSAWLVDDKWYRGAIHIELSVWYVDITNEYQHPLFTNEVMQHVQTQAVG